MDMNILTSTLALHQSKIENSMQIKMIKESAKQQEMILDLIDQTMQTNKANLEAHIGQNVDINI